MKKFIIILNLFLLVISCSGLDDAGKVLRNEKIKTTDEFLVKKRAPLVIPPDFDEIPKPGDIEKKDDKQDIKKILRGPKINDINNKKPSSIEESVLDKINK